VWWHVTWFDCKREACLVSARKFVSICYTFDLRVLHADFLEMVESHKPQSSIVCQLSTVHQVVVDLNMCVCVCDLVLNTVHLYFHSNNIRLYS
jgi:hypothetical protein